MSSAVKSSPSDHLTPSRAVMTACGVVVVPLDRLGEPRACGSVGWSSVVDLHERLVDRERVAERQRRRAGRERVLVRLLRAVRHADGQDLVRRAPSAGAAAAAAAAGAGGGEQGEGGRRSDDRRELAHSHECLLALVACGLVRRSVDRCVRTRDRVQLRRSRRQVVAEARSSASGHATVGAGGRGPAGRASVPGLERARPCGPGIDGALLAGGGVTTAKPPSQRTGRSRSGRRLDVDLDDLAAGAGADVATVTRDDDGSRRARVWPARHPDAASTLRRTPTSA